jgi:hypothetical protein
MVQVRGGADAVASAEVKPGGRFEVEVRLKANTTNELRVSQSRDGLEGPAEEITIVHDNLAPETPEMDPETSPTRRTLVSLSGRTEANAEVAITGGLENAGGTADAEGRFSLDVRLTAAVAELTQNDLMIVATDAAGNASAPALVTIVHNPNLPIEAPELDPLPAATNSATIAVTGRTEPGLTVSIAGGTLAVETIADASGTFSVNVPLRPNTINTLSAFAIILATGLSSPARTVEIAHDDVAPDAPALDPVGSPTGATLVLLTGAAEADSEIVVAGGAAPALGRSDLEGRFSVEVTLLIDAVNTLEVRAKDLAGNEGPAATLSVEQDSSLEAPVFVDPIPSPTVQTNIEMTGRAEANVDIQITGGAQPVTATTDANGGFSAQVELNANATNTLHVFRTGSTVETVVVVVHDDLSPEAPALDQIASPTNQSSIAVAGSSEPGAHISVSGAISPADGTASATGRFSIQVQIAEDDTTTLTVIATDRAGNSSQPSTITVEHSSSVPDAPIVDDPSPDPTNEPSYVVTGRVSSPGPGIEIRISGGAQPNSGPADPTTGTFAVEVSLDANSTNTLEIVSVEGAIESPPALVTIEHDDVAPNAPDANRITVGTPSFPCIGGPIESVGVTGGSMSVEGFARVRVSNVTRSGLQSSADASQGGAFSTTILACSGDVLRITATDAAGNTSLATDMPVE